MNCIWLIMLPLNRFKWNTKAGWLIIVWIWFNKVLQSEKTEKQLLTCLRRKNIHLSRDPCQYSDLCHDFLRKHQKKPKRIRGPRARSHLCSWTARQPHSSDIRCFYRSYFLMWVWKMCSVGKNDSLNKGLHACIMIWLSFSTELSSCFGCLDYASVAL